MASDHQVMSAPVSTDNDVSGTLRKRNRNKDRVKVTRACDRCKKRKVKCNGTQPCAFCLRAKASCTFSSAYARGRIPSILPSSRIDNGDNGYNAAPGTPNIIARNSSILRRQCHPLLPRAEPEQDGFNLTENQNVSSLDMAPSTSTYAEASSHMSPDPCEMDLQEHYIGPASGVSFLQRIQKRLHQAISRSQTSSIFMFGDAPVHLPESDPSFCMMLPRTDAQRLVDRYFDFAMPTYRFLHRPTIQDWFNEFYDTLGTMRDSQKAPVKVALLFMVFAHARVYMPDDERPGPPDLSTRYFLAADHQLTKEKGSICLTSVQARLTQCYYLLTQSRINHCWSLFGTVSRLALAIGLNRDKSPDVSNSLSLVEAECRRRTFWCAYTLDAYLSSALGRPRAFHDDDIDTELPACVEDENLMTENINITMVQKTGPSTMLAARAHMKIAQIIGKILSRIYSIKPISASERMAALIEISKDLSNWRTELARFLDVDNFSTAFLIPIYQRQRNVLNLTYWHAVILSYRPFVLRSLARLPEAKEGDTGSQDITAQSLKECLDAAMQTVNTINEITASRQLFRAFWITTYFAFNATIMLYVYVIHERESLSDVCSSYFAAATRCQSNISAIAEKGSLSERYCLVLEELRVEALRQTKSMHTSTSNLEALNSESRETGSQRIATDVHQIRAPTSNFPELTRQPEVDSSTNTLGFSFSDYAVWDQFTSMVSSGIMNMDTYTDYGSYPA